MGHPTKLMCKCRGWKNICKLLGGKQVSTLKMETWCLILFTLGCGGNSRGYLTAANNICLEASQQFTEWQESLTWHWTCLVSLHTCFHAVSDWTHQQGYFTYLWFATVVNTRHNLAPCVACQCYFVHVFPDCPFILERVAGPADHVIAQVDRKPAFENITCINTHKKKELGRCVYTQEAL